MTQTKMLIFVPTYDEKENAEAMCQRLLGLDLETDILFLDDNSPDGTGEILDAIAAGNSRVTVIHRPGKNGIGSAHKAGIAYAYEHEYETLISLDCDFTHDPDDIPRLLACLPGVDLVVGSRYMRPNSLPNWNLYRKFMTKFGHVLTKRLLNLPQDATGALRVYDLMRVPHAAFKKVTSGGYSFFFESLFVMSMNGFRIAEVPIVLPNRMYGHSKMTVKDVIASVKLLVKLFVAYRREPGRFLLDAEVAAIKGL